MKNENWNRNCTKVTIFAIIAVAIICLLILTLTKNWINGISACGTIILSSVVAWILTYLALTSKGNQHEK